MSEYQYYDFVALDQPLSTAARQEMNRLSSRVQLTATSASFVYNYSDLPANPKDVLSKYFDAMLYISNWGVRQIMFRFPAHAIPDHIVTTYQYDQSLQWSQYRNYTILNIEPYDEEPDYEGWVEGEGLLAGIASIRNDILRGDYRGLYLGWLAVVSKEINYLEDDEDLNTPPIPPSLQKLSGTLKNFANFFGIPVDLISAAAQLSPNADESQQGHLDEYLDKLPDDEKNAFLQRLLKGESHLDIALRKRLLELSGAGKTTVEPEQEKHTIRQLMGMMEQAKQTRLEKERQEAEAALRQKLEKIAPQQDYLWQRVDDLVALKKTKPYDEAVEILKDLKALAKSEGKLTEFREKLNTILNRYPTLRGFHQRVEKAGL